MKIYNLRSVDLGRGLRTTITDRAVWAKYGDKGELVRDLATAIRAEISTHRTELAAHVQDEDDNTPYPEGRILTAMHRRRERNPQLRAKLIRLREKQGALVCEMCEWGRSFRNQQYFTAALEAHHVVPLSHQETRTTRLSDLALLCANCHRLIHKVIAVQGKWVDVAECIRFLAGEDLSN
jgi:5-methylcytosine-specific restriction protein A